MPRPFERGPDMPDDSQQKDARSKVDGEILDAIAAFEKIIEALPNERVSLEALAVAYEQLGDHARAKNYMIRLANVLIDEGEEDAAQDLVGKMRGDSEDPEIKAVLKRIEELEPEKIMAVVEEETETVSAPPAESISDEMAFAWSLRQAGKLSQEDYSNVIHDLTENSARSSGTVISTLHVLNDRAAKNMSEILAYVADECGTPIIPLSCFDIPPAVQNLIPVSTMIRRKAIPFETMGNDLLVAALNPYDTKLLGDLQNMTGRICHMYLAQPADFDVALEKVKNSLAADEKSADALPKASRLP